MDLLKNYGTIGVDILEKYCKEPGQFFEVMKGKLTKEELSKLITQMELLQKEAPKEQ